LIGGASHVGKSTTAKMLAARLGWPCLSTDSLARHPGRPWPTPTWAVPPHVAEHYSTLSTAELLESVLAHYERIWPMIRERIVGHATDVAAGPLVLEGSALWPERVAELNLPQVRAVWLTADHALIESRMRRESAFEAAEPGGQALIRSFLARTWAYDDAMMAAVRRLALPVTEATAAMSIDDVADACSMALGGSPHL
jgi:2-phosphoglycerate kinase